MSGDLLGHALIFGFEKVVFPEKYLSGDRILTMALDEMMGNTVSRCSEIALGEGRALLIHDSTKEEVLPWLMCFVLLPFGRIPDLEATLDALSLIIHRRLRLASLSRRVVV